jgi:hypothetical protein
MAYIFVKNENVNSKSRQRILLGNRENSLFVCKATKDINIVGFKIKKTCRIFKNLYHRFFNENS